jgi:hypothetical protein
MWTRGGADRRRRLAPWMGAGLLLCVGALKADPTSQDAGARVSIAEILRHLRTLGDDAMEGRGTGTAGGERAAAYLESQTGAARPRAAGRRRRLPAGGAAAR